MISTFLNFANAKTLYTYRLNGGGAKASNTYATAKHSGTRGNDLRVVIQVNEEETSNYDVSLYLGSVCVDKQTVKVATELKDSLEEQAFIIASTDLQIEKKKRDVSELEHKIGRGKGKG